MSIGEEELTLAECACKTAVENGRQRWNRTRRSSADADKNEDGFVGSGASWLDSLGGQREENAVVLAAVFYSCGAARDDGVELGEKKERCSDPGFRGRKGEGSKWAPSVWSLTSQGGPRRRAAWAGAQVASAAWRQCPSSLCFIRNFPDGSGKFRLIRI